MASAKPLMRGFMVRKFKRDMVITAIIATVSVVAHRVLVVEPRKHRYAEYWRTFDPVADFERKKEAGVFTIVKPGEVI